MFIFLFVLTIVLIQTQWHIFLFLALRASISIHHRLILDTILGLVKANTTTKMPKKANIFESFSHSAIQQFKEAFGIMDADKDGLLSASDLVAAFGAHGKSIGSGDAQV